jgi:hypothetical protein
MNYEKIYNDIISKARSEDRKKIKGGIYYERHHIIPRCLGGSNDKSNLILLTAKEHYICHRLLSLIYPNNNKLKYAVWCMINGLGNPSRYIPSGKIYKRLRELHASTTTSIETRKKISNSNKGKVRSKETLKKMSLAQIGKTRSEETKKKMSEAGKLRTHTKESKEKMSGKFKSEATKKKMSDSLKGRVFSEEHKLKLSVRRKLRITSEETKKKMSESQKKRFNTKI